MSEEFTVDALELHTHIKWVSQGVSKAQNSQYVKMAVRGDKTLELSAFNHVNSYRGLIDLADVSGESKAYIVDGEALIKIMRLLRKGKVKVKANASEMVFTTTISTVNVPIMSSVRLPNLPDLPPKIGTVDAVEFAAAVKQVSRAAGNEHDRNFAILTCVNVEVKPAEKKILLTATARYYLAHREIEYTPADKANKEETSYPISGYALSHATADMVDGAVLTLHASSEGSKRFGMTSNNKSVYLGVMNDNYVNYKPLLRTKTEDATALLNRSVIARHLTDAIALSVNDRVSLTFSDNSMVMKTTRVQTQMDVKYKGEEKIVTFNSEHLRVALSLITTNQFTFLFPVNPKQGVLLRELDNEKSKVVEEFLGLVSPTV